MSGILDMIAQHMDPGMVTQISNQMGVDPNTAQKAMATALPGVFGAMSEHASSESGAAEIHEAIQQASPSAATPAAPASDPGLLDKLLGHRTDAVQQNVAQASGLNMQQAGKVLMYLAPIAVAVLARHHAEQPQAAQGPGGLSNILSSAAQATQGAGAAGGLAGGLGGMLGRVLG